MSFQQAKSQWMPKAISSTTNHQNRLCSCTALSHTDHRRTESIHLADQGQHGWACWPPARKYWPVHCLPASPRPMYVEATWPRSQPGYAHDEQHANGTHRCKVWLRVSELATLRCNHRQVISRSSQQTVLPNKKTTNSRKNRVRSNSVVSFITRIHRTYNNFIPGLPADWLDVLPQDRRKSAILTYPHLH